MSRYVIGIDIGGTGSRAAIGGLEDATEDPSNGSGRATFAPRRIDEFSGPRVGIGSSGSSVLDVINQVIRSAARRWETFHSALVGVGIGATGVASLAEDPGPQLARFSATLGVPVVAAIDAVTAHLGALGGTGGAITVLGTGAIAVGHPGPDEAGAWPPQWRRIDGWGHLLGDRGGGAWLGRHGLEQALRSVDGVDIRGSALLEAAVARFGPPPTWPGRFYTRDDRARQLAAFATDIAECARSGDEASQELMLDAGREAARSAVAASPHDSARIAVAGGLTAAGDPLLSGFAHEVHRLMPNAHLVQPEGSPLDGSLHAAALSAAGLLLPQEGTIWT